MTFNLKKTTMGLAAVAAILATVIFFGSNKIFPPIHMPPMSVLPAFMFLGVWDAVAFGVGIAILLYLGLNYSKWPKEIRRSLLVLFFIALWFSALNWVHDGFHNMGAMPPNWAFLAVTEYLFHFPWLVFSIALVLVAKQLVKAYKKAG